ncbi:MAG: HK97 gp10 family phage protein [Acetobacterium sp.]|uniref:HK97 gp10 family phage protein n=1 Tax=Acetobacterium sp. TaxID=1872094 RepID=UPI003242178A
MMGKNVNYKQFEQFKKKLEKTLDNKSRQKFMEDCTIELLTRLLSRVIKRTPVGEEDGGNLRRSWTIGSTGTGESLKINVEHIGGVYQCTLTNTADYASYVNYGHRTRGGGGWVDGQFFLTISENEVNDLAPALLEKRLAEYLKEAFK